MKKILAGIAILGLCAGAATSVGADGGPRRGPKEAPDPAPTAFSWTGFYVGGTVGMAWGNSDARTATGCPATSPPGLVCSQDNPASLANVAVLDAVGSGPLSPTGFTGALQAGYNLQRGNLLYGVELDYGVFSLDTSRGASANLPVGAFGGPISISSSLHAEWLFTARGRLGWVASPNLLIYATGGLALANLRVTNSYSDDVGGIGGANTTSTKTGWTVGGGMEYALSKNWTVKGEYLYVDFGAASVSGNITSAGFPVGTIANPLATSADLTAHIARGGVNYKF